MRDACEKRRGGGGAFLRFCSELDMQEQGGTLLARGPGGGKESKPPF